MKMGCEKSEINIQRGLPSYLYPFRLELQQWLYVFMTLDSESLGDSA